MKEGYMDLGEDVAKIGVFLLTNGDWGHASRFFSHLKKCGQEQKDLTPSQLLEK